MARNAVELAKRAVRPDPEVGLPAVGELRAHLETVEAWHVENALRSGWSWTRVGKALGITKQAAHRKHAERVRARLPQRLTVTAEARRAVFYAREEASALAHASVGSQHLLLGILRDGDSVASTVLRSLGVSTDAARARVAADGARGRRGGRDRPTISPRARVILEQSLREAVKRADVHLGTEHLLLAVVHEADGAAGKILGGLGVRARDVERALDEARERAE